MYNLRRGWRCHKGCISKNANSSVRETSLQVDDFSATDNWLSFHKKFKTNYFVLWTEVNNILLGKFGEYLVPFGSESFIFPCPK
jgi:hypothetical protein